MKSKHPGKLLLALVAAAAMAIAMVAPAAQAATPNPGYEQFAGCPTPAEDALVEACLKTTITGGHFQMGSKTVPISKPIALTGGLRTGGDIVFNSEGGLEQVPLEVPGGIVGLTGLDWLTNTLNADELKVYAITELAGTANLTDRLQLPIKVRLVNPALGDTCYVGSDSSPIQLTLITGTTKPPLPNEPITGREADFGYDEATEIIHLTNGVFVDNSFAAPAAEGCALNLGSVPVNMDAAVNLQSGLPSPAGTNETVQNWEAEIANPFTVYAP